MRQIKAFVCSLVMAAVISGMVFLPESLIAAGQQFEFLLNQQRYSSGALAGGKVYFYEAGTTTNKAIYTNIGLTAAAANPYTLDANGTALLYGNGTYRVVIKTAALVTVYDRDNIKVEDLYTDLYGSGYTATIKPLNITGNDTGRIQGYSFGSASYTDNGYFSNLFVKNSPYVDVRAFGAVGDNTTDDTAAIQAAIDNAAVNGGTVIIPAGTYLVTSSINARSNVKIEGVYGESATNGLEAYAKAGTKFRWGGANGGTILRVYNTRLFKLDGIYLDGGTHTGVTGILLDSTNTPSGSQNEFHRFTIRDCLIGVQWGTSGIAGGSYANDGARFSTFTIWSSETGSKGFVVNSGNAGQDSTIESGGIQVDDIGIDIVIASQLQIRRVFGGWWLKTAFIRISVGIDILIEGSSSEGWGTLPTGPISCDSNFLKFVSPVESYPALWATVTMIQNHINNPIVVDNSARITSINDGWGDCRSGGVYIHATATFTGGVSSAVVINNGTEPTGLQRWTESDYVHIMHMDPAREWTTPVYDNASSFTASGSMTWTVDSADVVTYARHLMGRTLTASFIIDNTTVGGTPSTELWMKIPQTQWSPWYVPSKNISAPIVVVDNGTLSIGTATVTSGDWDIAFKKADGTNFTASDNNTSVRGQITVEVQ